MALFDLNVAPVDEDEEGILQEPKTEVNNSMSLPIKKPILVVLKEEQRHRDDDDACDASLKRQKIETTACFTPKTPSRITESPVQMRQNPRPGARITTRPSFVSTDCSVDASGLLLPEYVKKNSEFKNMSEAKLVIEKTLTQADIDKQQDRLSIPYKQIKTKFLTDSELGWLARENPKNQEGKGNKKKCPIAVKVIGPSSDDQVRDMSITRWNYKGSDGFRFAITGGWTSFLKDNDLKLNDLIQVVSFRVDNRLCLAILKPHTCL